MNFLSYGRGQVLELLSAARFPLEDEARCQSAICSAFQAAGFAFLPEAALQDAAGTPLGRVDFLVRVRGEGNLPSTERQGKGCMGVEVKVGSNWGARDVLRQMERYALCPAIERLVLATNRPMSLPIVISGKEVHIVHLGKGWL